MRLLTCWLFSLFFFEDGTESAELPPTTGHSVHINDGNFSDRDHMKQESIHIQQQVLERRPGSAFKLKVQVNSALSRQVLNQAVVEIYINYTRTTEALTGQDGSVLLDIPYQDGMPMTIVARKDGYTHTLLPYKASRMPLFSSVTLYLLRLNQGNIWLFDDSVLITGETSDASSQPVVQFPKSLLNLTDSRNITAVRAYLTVPKLPSQDDTVLITPGIMSSKTGYISVDLSPVAAVSVQLFSGDTELHLSGPIQIRLSLPDSCGLQSSNTVPAWFFNSTTGGWMRKGLGTVVSVEGKLMWNFTAPHLGYWIAAPLSPSRGFFGFAVPLDFIVRHSYVLMLILGGVLLFVICLLVGLLFCRRSSSRENMAKKILPVSVKDQTTSTCEDDVFEVSSGDPSHPQSGLNQSFTEKGDNLHNASVISMHNGSIIANPGAVSIAVECNELDLNTASLTENLFFYNQPVAILHAPAFFHLEEQPERPQWCKSATLPRAGASNGAAAEPPRKDSFTQTQPKGPSNTQSQTAENDDQLGASENSQPETSSSPSRSHVSLPESASVPGTLTKMVGSRHSVHAFAELSKIPSLQPPRAWFVSLEGKPAAEIHYAVSEQQRRRRPAESRETSLDSGVDMSELNQTSGRRAVTLERNNTFVKSTSSSKNTPSQ
ncbi:protein FAM171B-like isoform X1 [Cheilinus undulatus]|uniref:protein FAM171B-like isoform X1 n=1 Tax=Cheilinus undulatus TaxID=241271 RepID=UPI001BD481DE|nr:protein FAM171B-like isoform X1 [Cheilinus undulatus]